jgi:hypothetical protein
MDKLELRARALALAATWIRTNVEAGVVGDLDHLAEPERSELEAILGQLAGELEEMAARKPRTRRAAKPEELKPYWLSVTGIQARDQPRTQYKSLQRAQAAARNMIDRENADPQERNPAQRVWVHMGDGKDSRVVVCYVVNEVGQAVIDQATMRNLGMEEPA